MPTEPPRRSRSPSPQRIRKQGARQDGQPDIETELRQLNDEVATLTAEARRIRAGTARDLRAGSGGKTTDAMMEGQSREI